MNLKRRPLKIEVVFFYVFVSRFVKLKWQAASHNSYGEEAWGDFQARFVTFFFTTLLVVNSGFALSLYDGG